VAARLQCEADPGGVCVSATVYDVVSNRVKFHVNAQVEPKLKNIGKMKAYQISPLEGGLNSPKGGGVAPRKKKAPSKIPWLALTLVFFGFVLFILVVGGVAHYVKAHARPNPSTDPVEDLSDVTPVKPPLQPTIAPEPTIAPTPPPTTSATTSGPDSPALFQEMEAARAKYIAVYDFKGFKKWLQGHMGDDSHLAYKFKAEAVAKGIDGLIHLFDWWKPTFKAHYSAQHPVHVRNLTGDKYLFYPVPPDSIAVVKNSEAPQIFPYSEMRPNGVASVISRVIQEQTSTTDFLSTHNAQEKNVLETELGIFRLVYLVPVRTPVTPSPVPNR
jgi:hypothetical protein